MKPEVGKIYISGLDEEVKIIEELPEGMWPVIGISNGILRSYTKEGKYYSDGVPSLKDLLREATKTMKIYKLEIHLTGCHVETSSWPEEVIETAKTFKLKEGFVLKSRLNKTTFRHQWGSFIASTYSFEEDFSGLKADLINQLTYERDYLTKQITAVNELT